MAEDKVTRIARQIYEEIGGPENVQSLVHCMTRVRLSMIDETKVNLENLKLLMVLWELLKVKLYKLSLDQGQ